MRTWHIPKGTYDFREIPIISKTFSISTFVGEGYTTSKKKAEKCANTTT
jgi:hypothetical protein